MQLAANRYYNVSLLILKTTAAAVRTLKNKIGSHKAMRTQMMSPKRNHSTRRRSSRSRTMSPAIFHVASGSMASRARRPKTARRSGWHSRNRAAAAIRLTLGEYAPNLPFVTKHTFPSSWPGRKLDSKIGKPFVQASAIVPGPAFVMTRSDALISSAILFTNPNTARCTFGGGTGGGGRCFLPYALSQKLEVHRSKTEDAALLGLSLATIT